MQNDPVCGMAVDPKKTKFSSNFKGKTYYFCSNKCKKDFDEDPQGFVA